MSDSFGRILDRSINSVKQSFRYFIENFPSRDRKTINYCPYLKSENQATDTSVKTCKLSAFSIQDRLQN